MKRYRKGSDLKTWYPNKDLERNIFCYGEPGSGKSTSERTLAEAYHERGYKIWDLFGGERDEGVYWAIPSQDVFWQKVKLLGELSEEGPKQYKVKFLYPYFGKKMPKKLPRKGADVISKAFTIPLKSITKDDIRVVTGNLSQKDQYYWDSIQGRAKRNDTAACLGEYCRLEGGLKTTLYRNFLQPMSENMFIMDQNCPSNLDVVEESKDRDTVVVLCLKYVPREFHIFVLNWIIRQMGQAIDDGKMRNRKNLCMFREVSNFFKQDDAIAEDKYKVFKSKMIDYLRMCRRGVFFIFDTQSPHEVRGLSQIGVEYVCMFKTTNARDKREMTEDPVRERRMKPADVSELVNLGKGECFINVPGQNVRRVQLVLPRSWFWQSSHPNFYTSLWERFGGEWTIMADLKEEIEGRFNDSVRGFVAGMNLEKYDGRVKAVKKADAEHARRVAEALKSVKPKNSGDVDIMDDPRRRVFVPRWT